MKFFLFLGVMILTGIYIISPVSSYNLPDSFVVNSVPAQTQTQTGEFTFKGYQITPLADFSLQARVLNFQKYSSDKEAELSPIDLALGWGPMSQNSVISKVEISQKGRWYFWRTDNFPIPREEIETNSANMHIIPADDDLKKKLMLIQKDNIIELQGYLVECSQRNWNWKSSLTRDDTGTGACEIIYITDFKIIKERPRTTSNASILQVNR
jgi:hypothetical protein